MIIILHKIYDSKFSENGRTLYFRKYKMNVYMKNNDDYGEYSLVVLDYIIMFHAGH
jgi:hypothetical protein